MVTRGLSVSGRREKELAKVTIKKEDLELIVSRAGHRAGRQWCIPGLGAQPASRHRNRSPGPS